MTEHSLSVTLKAGTGYDAPWVVVYGDNPDEVQNKLDNLGNVLKSAVSAAAVLRSLHTVESNGLPVAEVTTAPAAPAQPSGWGKPAAQQAPVPQQQAGVVYHPVDVCGGCGSRVQEKVITSKKSGKTFELWTCPNQRAKGDGHYSEFKD